MYRTITVSEAGAVTTVALNRPDVRNAFNAQMVSDLTQAFGRLASARQTRAIVLRGNGPAFCAGADIRWMRAGLELTSDENRADAERLWDMFHAVDTVPVPVIGRVHGAALGGGMGLLSVCDIVVAEEGTVLGFTETKLGIVPAVISLFVLPRIGPSWARALFLTGERFTPDLARQIGLVHWVVPSSQLDAIVEMKVGELLQSGPEAVGAAKVLIAAWPRLEPEEMRRYTVERIAQLRAGSEGQEGLRAFLEKRKPAWHEGR